MSRIGLKPIPLENGVDVNVQDRAVVVKGAKGTLTVTLPPAVTATVTPEKTVVITVKNPDNGTERAQWGLARQLVANAVQGVQKPYEKALEFVGVGYRVSAAGNVVKMEVGFSHPVEFSLPQGIDAKVEKQVLTLSGIDKQMLGEAAAQIRRVRPPEPYKGKGIKYVDEVIRRKAGKTAKTAA